MTEELDQLLQLKKPKSWSGDDYRAYRRLYRKRDRLLHPQKNLAWERKHREQHREKLNARAREYYHNNRAKCRAFNKRYHKTHADKVRDRMRKFRSENAHFRIRQNLSKRLNRALKNKYRVNASTMEMLGCSLQEFMRHLESRFTKGMAWNNYGKWHIDHIIPCASFDLTNPIHQRRCFHYSNLQPLWALENLQKEKKITVSQFNLL